MKKIFIEPKLLINSFSTENIITASGDVDMGVKYTGDMADFNPDGATGTIDWNIFLTY